MSRREEGLKEKIKKEKVKKKDKKRKDEQEAFPTIQEWVSGEDTSSSSSDGSNNLLPSSTMCQAYSPKSSPTCLKASRPLVGFQ